MIVVVQELRELVPGECRQKITVGDKPIQLAHVCPYLLRYLDRAGTIYMQLQDASGRKIADSNAVTVTDIGTGDYWHGFYKFDLVASLKENTDYYLELKAGTYIYGVGNKWVGWCTDYEWRNSFPSSVSPNDGLQAPFGLRLWGYNFTNKGDLL